MLKSLSSLSAAFVLGMHDALVSQIGIIVGMVFAAAGREIIILTSVISALSAGLSMAASSYLAEKTNLNNRAVRAGLVTGLAYLGTSGLLIAPFFITPNIKCGVISALVLAVVIIFVCNWAICRQRGHNFWRHAFEMLAVCTTVTIVTFVIGEFAKQWLGN